MSHTPGPWQLIIDADNGLLREVAAPCHEHQDCGKTIVFIRRDPTQPLQSSHGEHMAANARLISAAPELLEALKRIRDLDINCSQQEDKAAWDQAHAAIAKAEGAQ